MMPRELGGVVDEDLFVYGAKKLRVIDAGIQPTLIGATTCQTVYAVAEKIAERILEQAEGGEDGEDDEGKPPKPPMCKSKRNKKAKKAKTNANA